MKITSFLPIYLLILQVVTIFCSQDILEAIKNNHTIQQNVDICGSESEKWCSCSFNVASCDFSSFQAKKKTIFDLSGASINESTKRLCFCNTPPSLFLNFTQDLIPHQNNSVLRVDLFNLTGPTAINKAFSLYFKGDLFLKDVSFLREIRSREFGRGSETAHENLEDFPCCSQIKSPVESSTPNVLHFENVTINSIHKEGIDSFHMWSIVIFRNVTFNHIKENGIFLNNGVNVSFTYCHFINLTTMAVAIEDFSNVLVAKSTFDTPSLPLAFYARSKQENSTLILVQNEFLNAPSWEMDAHSVIVTMNYFNFWYNYSFISLNKTAHPRRKFFIEYNFVDNNLLHNETTSTKNWEHSAIFHENTLGKCNCSGLSRKVPYSFTKFTNRCVFGKQQNNPDKMCLLHYNITNYCHNEIVTNDNKLCSDPTIATSFSRNDETKPFFKSFSLHSQFLEKMINLTERISSEIKSMVTNHHLPSIFDATLNETELLKSQYNTHHKFMKRTNKNYRKSVSTLLLVILCLSIVATIAYFGYTKFKKRANSLLTADSTTDAYLLTPSGDSVN